MIKSVPRNGTLCLFIIFILIDIQAFAKKPDQRFFVYDASQRYLKTDLNKLSRGSSAARDLRNILNQRKFDKHHKNQNLFILGYLEAFEGAFQKSAQIISKIDHDSPEYAMAQTYWHLFWGQSWQTKLISRRTLDQHHRKLSKLKHFIPTSFNQQFQKAVDLMKLLSLIQAPHSDIQPFFLDQLVISFSQASVSQTQKTKLLSTFHGSVSKKSPDHVVYLESLLQEHFPKHPKIQKNLPPQKDSKTIPLADQNNAKAILDQAALAKKNDDDVLAIEYWTQLLKTYSGTQSYDKAKAELRLAIKRHLNKDLPLAMLLPALKKLPPDMLYSEGRYLWNRSHNDIARDMFLVFIEHFGFHPKAPNAYYILGSINETQKLYAQSRNFFEQLAQQYPESEFFDRARFKVGLLSYLLEDDTKAIKVFTQEALDPSSKLSQAQGHYWLYKTYQRQGNQILAQKHTDEVLKDFPFTYYATVLDQHPPISTKQFFDPVHFTTDPHSKNIDLYLSLGLHSFIDNEIQHLNSQQGHSGGQELYYVSEKLSKLELYLPSMRMMYRLLSQQKHIHPDTLNVFFPISPFNYFFDDKTQYAADPLLLLSIMKQESAFNPKAVSHAKAYGLLQLIMPTAKTMARKNKISITKADLFKPKTNILLGSSYVAQNLKKFDNRLIDVLIAYNAGPGRAKRWRQRWSDMEPEIFIELIPIQETRTYVKLILRNLYFYQRLYPKTFNQAVTYKALPKVFYKKTPVKH